MIGQFFLEFLELFLGAFFRHLDELVHLVVAFVEFFFNIELLLLLAQFPGGFLGLFALLDGGVVAGDQVEGIDGFLFLHAGALEVGFLQHGLQVLGGELERLRGHRRRVLKGGQHYVGIAHPVAVVLLEDVLFVGVGADQVFERFDPEVDLLLADELRLGLGFVRLLRGLGGGEHLRVGHYLEGGLLLGEGKGELADFRGEFGEVQAGVGDGFLEVGKRFPQLAGHQFHIAAHALGLAGQGFAGDHFLHHRAERRGAWHDTDERGGQLDGIPRHRILELQAVELGGQRDRDCAHARRGSTAGGDPRPIARRRGARAGGSNVPALGRGQRGQAVHQFLQVVGAFQQPQRLVELVEAFGGFFRAVARRQRLD